MNRKIIIIGIGLAVFITLDVILIKRYLGARICRHENGIVWMAKPVVLERRAGAKQQVNYRAYCVDCDIEFIEQIEDE